jgi:hypothetical protein
MHHFMDSTTKYITITVFITVFTFCYRIYPLQLGRSKLAINSYILI